MLLFLHLSDIHFHKASGGPFDLDEDLRNELILDAREFAEKNGQPDAIVVGGDIAYSGRPIEYETAKEWINDFVLPSNGIQRTSGASLATMTWIKTRYATAHCSRAYIVTCKALTLANSMDN